MENKFKEDRKIGSIAKDTCGTCWAFTSELKRIDAAKARRRGAELEGEPIVEPPNLEPNSIEFAATKMEVNEDELEDNESNNQLINTSQSTSFIVPNSISTNLNIGLQIDSTDDINEEEIIVKMGAHVEAFRAQRKYTKKKALESKLDLESNITWPDKRYCVCGDYSQNS